jgi:hypothetical protein
MQGFVKEIALDLVCHDGQRLPILINATQKPSVAAIPLDLGGYRLMEQVRARTTSPNPALRFLLMGVALLIVNMWIRLHWLYLRVPAQGPRRVAREYFRLERMTRFLTRAIERIYGVISAVDPPPKPKPVIY